MDIDPAFVSDSEAAEAAQPREAAFDHPSMTPELLAGVDAAPSDTWLDPATTAGTSASPMIVGFVGVQLVWPSARPAASASNMRNCVEQSLQRHTVVDVGPCQQEDERDAVAVRDKVAFGAGLASIRRVRTDGCTPSHGVLPVKGVYLIVVHSPLRSDPEREPVSVMQSKRPHHLTSGRADGLGP